MITLPSSHNPVLILNHSLSHTNDPTGKMLSATAGVGKGTVPLFLSGIFLLQEWKWEVIVTNGPLGQLRTYVLQRRIPGSGWLPADEALTSHNILTPYWDEMSRSAQPPSLHSPYWLFSWPEFVNVFLSSTGRGQYMCPDTRTGQDTSCGCFFPLWGRSPLPSAVLLHPTDVRLGWDLGSFEAGYDHLGPLSCSSNGICDLAG